MPVRGEWMKRVPVQELPAVEGLARVDVLCTDKTGTLTEGRLTVAGLEALATGAEDTQLAVALGELAAADPAPFSDAQEPTRRYGQACGNVPR
jgi:cation-transporting P-type ATPase E